MTEWRLMMTKLINRIATSWRELDRSFCTLQRIQWAAPWRARATRC
jgi:hypothetical protein